MQDRIQETNPDLDANFPFLFSSSPSPSASNSGMSPLDWVFPQNFPTERVVVPPGFPPIFPVSANLSTKSYGLAFNPLAGPLESSRPNSRSISPKSSSFNNISVSENWPIGSPTSKIDSSSPRPEFVNFKTNRLNNIVSPTMRNSYERSLVNTSPTSQLRIRSLTFDLHQKLTTNFNSNNNTPKHSPHFNSIPDLVPPTLKEKSGIYSYENSFQTYSRQQPSDQSNRSEHTSGDEGFQTTVASTHYDFTFLSSPPSSPTFSTASWFTSSAAAWSSGTKPSHREKLISSLGAYGFVYKDLQGYGDCLFEALADQQFEDTLRHLELRASIVREIKSCWPAYILDIRANYFMTDSARDSDAEIKELDDLQVVKEYTDRIMQSGEIGDAICIAAFAKLYNCDVAVYLWNEHSGFSCFMVEAPRNKELDPTKDPMFWSDEETALERDGRPVKHIAWYQSESGFESGNHYFSVFPPPGFEGL
ncbi:hypothetical protein HK096_009665 [Nowakowskiella sp. JEL0078]|nr:hypothetical protein HK096_009665 [Nowakowskiella sp. JEL0078]